MGLEHGYACGSEDPPYNALKLGYENAYGDHVYMAVANTEHGTVPGKARPGTCWYSYGGSEHSTSDFKYVTWPNSMFLVPNTGDGPPPGARPIGHQTDGAGDLYAAVATNTEWGNVPGKATATANVCWYPAYGKEYYTSDFKWLTCSRLSSHDHDGKMDTELRDSCDGYPDSTGYDERCLALANTDHGTIPCKAAGGSCWYSYYGEEHQTNSFSYVVRTSPHRLVPNDHSGPPQGAAVTGHQHDHGDLYAAIAITEWGRIPGKADGHNTCWYPYGGSEYTTEDFEWLCF